MQKLRIVVSLPNDNAYQHEQGVVATATGKRLGLDLEVTPRASSCWRSSNPARKLGQTHFWLNR
jgi:hypothetical protein